MFAAALRRNIGNRSFDNLQQCLLNALARNIAGNRRPVGFTGNLIDFININDAALRFFNIIIRSLHQFQDNIFDVFADIAGFGQRRRVRNGKRHIQNFSQRLRQQGFTAAGRTD